MKTAAPPLLTLLVMKIQQVFLHLKCGLERVNLIIAFYCYFSSSEKHLRNSGLNGDPKPDPCNAGAVLYQLSCQAN